MRTEKSRALTNRYGAIDAFRGFSVLNMIAYHAIWDLVYIFGFNWRWYSSEAAYVWQQCICQTFIILSGFCATLGKHRLKRGATVLLCGCMISVITSVAVPQDRVIFGILTLIGSCMLLIIPLEKLLKKVNPYLGMVISIALFVIIRNINEGYICFYKLPQILYSNKITAYFGFPPSGFNSADYFSLFPWVFLFISGYFLYCVLENKNLLCKLKQSRIGMLEWVGRHSLIIYLLHQPIIYLLFLEIF